MQVRSFRHEIRILRYYALGMTFFAGAVLLGAAHEAAKIASFDTITVHRINVVDREGKLAMVITDHDDMPPPIINGKVYERHGGANDNGIIFYNQRGDEQGGLVWDGQRHPNGTFDSGNSLSFDTVNTDQLIHVEDGNVNGKTYSEVVGWNQPDYNTPGFLNLITEADKIKTKAQAQAFLAAHPEFRKLRSKTRFILGYDQDNTSQVVLADGQGRPRIKMYVTADGTAALQFLDENGKVVAEYPQASH
jgi:hypothetical protein